MSTEVMNKPKKECFIICPIGDDGSATRARSDKVLRHIIQPAAKECGYVEEHIVRADKMPRPGVITSQVIHCLIDANLVVADLSDCNPNVFYELAVRHVLKKPVVQLMQAGQRIPFDIAQMRTISYDLTDPDNVIVSRDQLIQQIRIAETTPTDADNPISAGIQLDNLVRSDNPLARSHAEIIAMLQDLYAQVGEVLAYRGGKSPERMKVGVERVKVRDFFSQVVEIKEEDDHAHTTRSSR